MANTRGRGGPPPGDPHAGAEPGAGAAAPAQGVGVGAGAGGAPPVPAAVAGMGAAADLAGGGLAAPAADQAVAAYQQMLAQSRQEMLAFQAQLTAQLTAAFQGAGHGAPRAAEPQPVARNPLTTASLKILVAQLWADLPEPLKAKFQLLLRSKSACGGGRGRNRAYLLAGQWAAYLPVGLQAAYLLAGPLQYTHRPPDLHHPPNPPPQPGPG